MKAQTSTKRLETAQRIKKAREDVGMTQLDVAKKLGLTPQAISNYERGTNSVPVSILFTLADLFGEFGLEITPDYLAGFTDAPDTRSATQGDIDRFDGEPTYTAKNLSRDEFDMIEKFKRLPPEERKRIQHIVNYEYEKVLDSLT